jgi:hypothetical protein
MDGFPSDGVYDNDHLGTFDAARGAVHPITVTVHFLYYNFVRIHKTLKTTPAMAAGVTDRLWETSDMVDVLEAWETA